MRLSEFAHGRDNNFNLLRILASLLVLVSHSLALAVGANDADPLLGRLGAFGGKVAVDVFFIASGFLVAGSLSDRQSARAYIRARFLRIFPGLWVMLLVTVFGIGLLLTTLPLASYLSNERLYWYLIKGATLITGVAHDLPGVFEHNHYPRTVNGSLWTLPYEIRMYVLLLAGWVGLRHVFGRRSWPFQVAIVAAALIAGVVLIARHFLLPAEGHFSRLFYMFFVGAGCYVMRDAIQLHGGLFWAMLAALLLAVAVNEHLFFVVYMLTLPFVVLYLAYRPAGSIRAYNKVGDYSFGLYIYAFPVQQAISALVPDVSVLSLLILSGVSTMLFAALSWHLVEQPCLRLKSVVGKVPMPALAPVVDAAWAGAGGRGRGHG